LKSGKEKNMFKNILSGIFAAVLVVAIGTAAYTVSGVNAANAQPTPSAGNGQAIGGNGQTGTGLNGLTIPTSDLSSEEAAALLFMREEEKLARDVYNTLYATWYLPTFQKIAASEQMHMDQLGLLLTRYNLIDPALAPGVFTDPKLQSLYTTLVAQGNQSLAAALKVGGAIEEIDILDLQTRLAQTDNADIQQVYNNLLNGSYNHLNALSRTLTNQTGETYVPQSLAPEQYQTILSGSVGNGGGRPTWADSGNRQGGGNR
jgi:hypothetical protein